MIVIMKPNASEEAVKRVTGIIESKGLTAHLSKGDQVTIIGVVEAVRFQHRDHGRR